MPHFPVFMTTAPSVPAGSREMRDNFSEHDPPRSSPYTAPSITPYLGLRSRLSQVWFNRWTILLILILARTLIACASIEDNLTTSRSTALSSCSSVETMGSVMVSMPHYLSTGVNEMTASGIEKSVNALMQTATLAITGVEELVVFVIGILINTILCLIKFAVNGSLGLVTDLMDNAQKTLNDLTKGLGDDMANIVDKFQNTYKDVVDKLSSVAIGPLSGLKPPTLSVNDDIDKLRKLQLPASLTDNIQKLKNSIPNFVDPQNLTENAIRSPFEKIRNMVNESLGVYTFNRSLFPVPQKEKMSFCSDDNGISGFFDSLGDIVSTGRKVVIGTLVVAAIIVCIPMAYREIRRWHTIRQRAHLISSQEHDPLDVVYIVSRPYTSTAGIKVSNTLKSNRRQILVRWVIAYATTDAALFVLTLALAGLFSCLCQYILLQSLRKEVPALSNQVAGFANLVTNKLNQSSLFWANGTNKAIASENKIINDNMFEWVGVGTAALNDTLNVFVDTVGRAINVTFGGTPLRQPVQEVLNCLVLLKVASIQKGLTWVKENAHVNMPQVPADVFSAGAIASIAKDAAPDSSFLSSPGDVAADKITNVVVRLVNSYEKTLATETVISCCVLGIYFIAVLSAMVRAALLWFGQDKVRGEGGAMVKESSFENETNDFRNDNQDRYGTARNIPMQPINRFTPSVQEHPVSSQNYNAPMPTTEAPNFNHDIGPAPRYSMAVEDKARQARADNPFADSKRSYSPDDFDTDAKR